MEANQPKTKVYNVIIMDRSGSMWDIQRPAIQGYNEVLGGVKADAARFADTQEHFITLVLFDSTSIDNVYWNGDPEKAERLTDRTYVPGAATPLYDAVGRTLTALEKELHGDTKHSVVVTIITDGYENSSHEYSLAAVRALIEHLKGEGWSFAYMGTDHDVDGVTVSLSITNVIKFEKTEAETRETFLKERRARGRHSQMLHDYEMINPCASWEERKVFESQIATGYYNDPMLNPAYQDRVTPGKVKTLAPNEVLVFGSNWKGTHAGGLAAKAVKDFGAVPGQADGLQGRCYGIITVAPNITPVEIGESFSHFLCYADEHPDKTFLVTEIGCGHAGFDPDQIAPYLKEGINHRNVHFPISFWMVFERMGLI